MNGKEFESLVLFRIRAMEEKKLLTGGRYGVQAVMMNDPVTGKPGWQVIPSLPDIEGIIGGTGQQFITELKVCSQSSYPLASTSKKRPRQIDHMLLRSTFGAKCYLLVHFNEYKLIRTSREARTFAFPVHPDLPFWREYASRERLSISRDEGELYASEVRWNTHSDRARKLTPDMSFLLPEAPFTLT